MARLNPRETELCRASTALLLVDMQKLFCMPGLDPDHLELDARQAVHLQLANLVIPNQVALLVAARASGVQVIHTIIQSLTEACRDVSLDHRLSGLMVPKSRPLAGPTDVPAPRINEMVIPKTSPGVFNSTNIDEVLRNLGVTRLIIAGVVTDQCVDMAVPDAADRGYLVSLPEDACATYSEARHRAASVAFGGYCWVTDTATIVQRLAKTAQAA